VCGVEDVEVGRRDYGRIDLIRLQLIHRECSHPECPSALAFSSFTHLVGKLWAKFFAPARLAGIESRTPPIIIAGYSNCDGG
jgi:hypothetical protein